MQDAAAGTDAPGTVDSSHDGPGGDRTSGTPIDRTGLVPGSGRYLVFYEVHPELGAPYKVQVLDLASGTVHAGNPHGTQVGLASWSPDGRSFVFGSTPGPENVGGTMLLRLLDDGFIPAQPIGTFQGVAANSADWTADGRFVSIPRPFPGGRGVEIVDAITLTSLGKIASPPTDGRLQFAPQGSFFLYTDGMSPPGYAAGQITAGGIVPSSPEPLPARTQSPTFSANGLRLFYTAIPESHEYYRELPGSAVPISTTITPGADGVGPTIPEPSGESILALSNIGGSPDAVRRFYLDPAKPPVVIGDPGRHPRPFFTPGERDPSPARISPDGSLYLLGYEQNDTDNQSIELVAASTLARFTLASGEASRLKHADWGATFWGSHLLYVFTEPLALPKLHAATIEGGKLVDTAVDSSDTADVLCLTDDDGRKPGPQDRLAYLGPYRTIELIDLRKAKAEDVATIKPTMSDFANLDCPLWSRDGKAFAYVEWMAPPVQTRIFVVSWSDGGPSQPRLVHESSGGIPVKLEAFVGP
jgi:hypothetical protein